MLYNEFIVQGHFSLMFVANLLYVGTIVSFMEEHGEITSDEADTVTGKSAAMVRRYFKTLTGTIGRGEYQ